MTAPDTDAPTTAQEREAAEAVARAATPGEWFKARHLNCMLPNEARHIAASSPSFVLRLLADMRRLTADRDAERARAEKAEPVIAAVERFSSAMLAPDNEVRSASIAATKALHAAWLAYRGSR